MMLHGMGQTPADFAANPAPPPSPLQTPQGTVDYQYCNYVPFSAAILDPTCWQVAFSSQGSVQSLPQAAIIGQTNAIASGTPPQTQIDQQSPQETINQIVAAANQGYTAAATAAASQDTGANPSSGICDMTSSGYSPFLCWLNQNQTYVVWGGIALAALFFLQRRF